ncbi:MAG: hypothetical protein WCZ27_05140 [Tissierellaceae bacterium]
MKNKYAFISYLILIALFISLPVIGAGFEDISLIKIILQLIFYIVIFAAVIFVSIYGTRFVANNYRRTISSNYMELLDVLNLPGGIKIIILKANNKTYILSHSNNGGVTLIDSMDGDIFTTVGDSFDNHLDKYKGRRYNDNILEKSFGKIINKLSSQKNEEVNKDEEDN